jgi:hypothetical protein
MRRLILLDQNAPRGLRQILFDLDVKSAYEMGWDALSNGKLLAAAEAAGFEIMLTGDQNIRTEQNLAGRKIALVVVSTNHWDTVKADSAAIVSACAGAGEGTYTLVGLNRPPLRRRPPPGRKPA